MKSKSIILFVLICSVLLLGTVTTSEANCSITGKVIYTYQSATTFTAYVSNSNLPTHYFYFYGQPSASLGNVGLINKINTAQAGNLKVNIVGNAGACGASGTYRYGGYVLYVTTYSMD